MCVLVIYWLKLKWENSGSLWEKVLKGGSMTLITPCVLMINKYKIIIILF